MIKLVTYPDPVLLEKSAYVKTSEIDSNIVMFAHEMYKIMKDNDGVGISAVQVGVLKRIIIVGDSDNQFTTLINPTIINSYGEQTVLEGCLSFPGIYVRKTRPTRVKVEYTDLFGHKQILKSRDKLLSHCIVHECEHLDGITLEIDKDRWIT